MGIFEKFKKGFQKSASAFTTGLKEVVEHPLITVIAINKDKIYFFIIFLPHNLDTH